MTTFLYRCPTTGYHVQGFVADDLMEDGDDAFTPVECLACRRIHLVRPATGEVLGKRDD